ncbi:MAG: anaerobic ribonucleoside-triphosphate reductase [Candidatus Syntrophonatronum acetioxidans]|uniref:Anaerobic ribonucleoside-triphosphate reductase n=1 Tax=Candidatus Syntrophonatronum acetioxidans TaxID=1795816 RepID=A0A424YBB9_9FIRM|nr:MAG: anaerobic ribonucleoside-triphosphate reductase [Candidatus Syntrophonatronum acetioxidans]
MFTEIRKRDGRIASFDEQKITEAIFKAAKAVGGEDRNIAQSLTNQVVNYLISNNGEMIPSVEEIQDGVEKILIENGHARTAKAYILYRDRRTRMREGKTELMDAVKEILVETSRENANINNSPSAKMLQIAMAASKKYYLTNLLPEDMGEAHEQGYFHIHDLDYYAKTLNCLQIDLKKLFQQGFHTGNGWIRPPQRIYSAAALSAIILQSNQNDMYGGQSFPHFDRDLGEVIRGFKHQPDEEETYQAMEGFIYNLNTMHSLRGRERIWVYDKKKKDFSTRSMEDLNDDFEEGRYQAFSLNYETGKTELKNITATIKHKNVNKLYTVRLKSGQKVTVTDNHSIMTMNDQGEINTAVPSHLERALVPRQLNLEKGKIVFDLTSYPPSSKYNMDTLELTPALAKLMGTYAAEGSVDDSTLYLALFDKEREEEIIGLLKEINPDFTVRLRMVKGKSRDLACNVGQQFAAFLGDKCGRGPSNKRVPGEIFLGEDKLVNSFLDGYLSGDGYEGTNRAPATSVSKELRDGIQLLFMKLGKPVSIREANSQSQFAATREKYLVAGGGHYCQDFYLSSYQRGRLEYRAHKEQTAYDYEFLRPLMEEVYGAHGENAKYFPLKPDYLQEIIEDLTSRILEKEEQESLNNLTRKEFWMDQLVDILPRVKTTERYHLIKKLNKEELPPFCKQLPVFYPNREMLSRFFLSETVNDKRGSRIDNNCPGPGLVMDWAKRILLQNKKMVSLLKTLCRSLQVWPLKVAQLIDEPHEEYVYDISVADNENFLTAEGIFVHNSRAGAQVPFSSINFGTDTTPEGRMVTRALLEAYEGGLGRGENPVFPNLVFRVKEGVNFNPREPNYDLFQLALRVASHRLNPAFSFMDSSFNKKYGDEISYMGCRTRTIANRHGSEISAGRGNIASVSLNLPRLALLGRGEEGFFKELDKLLNLAVRQLLHRFEILSELTEKDLPFLIGERLYMDSEKLEPCEPIREVIKHGTLSIGFIGLAEALMLLVGSHHGETAEAQELGLKIVEHMWKKTQQFNDEYDLNFALYATPAEGLSGRFLKIDRNLFGSLPGVTDKEYYTNSYHLPVNYLTSLYQKIKVEGQYHTYCNGGHISYVELPSPPKNNEEVVESIIRYMAECNVGYGGINYPVDECNECNFSGIISQNCPQCQGENIRRIRRITGYLSTETRFNSAKKAELRDRKSHINDCC